MSDTFFGSARGCVVVGPALGLCVWVILIAIFIL